MATCYSICIEGKNAHIPPTNNILQYAEQLRDVSFIKTKKDNRKVHTIVYVNILNKFTSIHRYANHIQVVTIIQR